MRWVVNDLELSVFLRRLGLQGVLLRLVLVLGVLDSPTSRVIRRHAVSSRVWVDRGRSWE
jgi:hypothetical protein